MSIRIKRISKTTPTARAINLSLVDSGINSRLLRTENSVWRGNPKSLLINWGSSAAIPSNNRAVVFNKPEAISKAVNKITSFEAMFEADVAIPWYVVKGDNDFLEQVANKAIENFGTTFLFRTTSTGFGGKGIHYIEGLGEKVFTEKLLNDPSAYDLEVQDVINYLYTLMDNDDSWRRIISNTKFVTEYFTAKDEFRVHVACGKVIFTQRKSLRTDEQRPAHPNFIVRNHENGFIFQQENINIPEEAKQEAIKAVSALGLDFGAVDIRCKKATSTRGPLPCVLEVNTAPGIQGSTLAKYVEVFKSVHNVLQNP